ncbi:MAG: hypothetical protein KF842_11185 [Caulobacter sp.]|nr:hypothetical protein [Caulobacter sp.]
MITTAYAASGVALLALTGCGGGAPDDGYGGPGPSTYEQPRTSTDLMGGDTAPPDDSGLVGGPRDFTGMDPIPNPENLPLPLRQQIYGHKFDHLRYKPLPGQIVEVEADVTPGAPLRSWRKADGTLVVAMRPIANPEDMTPRERRLVYGKRYAPQPSSAPRHNRNWFHPKPKLKPVAPTVKAQAPKPVPAPRPAPAPAPKVAVAPPPVKAVPPPVVAPVPAPKIAPPAVAPAAKAPPVDPKMAQLSSSVGPEVAKGAVLTVPDSLAKGEESKVTLSLPINLLDVIQKEAAKLGLTKSAKKAEVSATLTGDGYTITPNAAQTQTLKKGEAASFDWMVKPGDGEKTPLKATVNGALTGQKGKTQTFSLATLEQTVARTVETAKSQAKKWGLPSLDKLALPGLKPIIVGGQVISPGATTAGIIAFVLLLILLAMARAGAGRRAREERRRKFRTMTDYNHAEDEAPAPEPEPQVSHTAHAPAAEVHAVEAHAADHHADPHHADQTPAAAGYEAGSSAMTFTPAEEAAAAHPEAHPEPAHADGHAPAAEAHADHGHDDHAHDDHAHGHAGEDHAPADHAHDDHGHAAHAHDDHGHADHGHGDHGHDDQAHDDHAHGDKHAEDHHHREPEHA